MRGRSNSEDDHSNAGWGALRWTGTLPGFPACGPRPATRTPPLQLRATHMWLRTCTSASKLQLQSATPGGELCGGDFLKRTFATLTASTLTGGPAGTPHAVPFGATQNTWPSHRATLPTTDSPGVTGPRRVSPRPPAVGSAPAGKLAPQADPSRTPATPAERGQQGSRTDGPSLVTSNEAAPSVTVGSQTLAPLKCTAASASKPGTPAVPDQPRQCSDQRGSVKVEDAVQQQQEEEERLDVPGAGGSLTAAAAVRQLVTAA